MSSRNPHVSIIIYRGEPLDYSKYRHTSIWLQFHDGSPALLVHIVGPAGEFELQTRNVANPGESAKFVKKVEVGNMTAFMTSNQAVELLKGVPIDPTDRESKCQTWVEGALKVLKNAGYLSGDMYDAGLSGMVDAIAEAEDEEE